MHYIELVKKASSEGVLLFLKDGNLAFKLRQGANFTDELKQEIRKNKAQIISFLQGVESDKKTKIKRAEYQHNQALPLSFAQQRLWFLDRLEGDSSQYNMPAAFELSGTFNISAAETALLRIIERHEVLRTVYVEGAEGSAQVVKPFSDVKFTIQQHDLRDVSGDAQAAQVQALLQADSEQAFDLTKDVMLRAAHIVLSEEEGVLLFNMHHIASDGWSMGLLSEEFITQYEAICAGHANPYGPLALQYADFALWQHEWLQGEVLDEQVRYWQTQLDALPAVHSLPLDFARPAEKAYTGATYIGVLSSTLTGQLQELAQRHQMTLFMVLHGVLSLVLSRHSNQHDIVLGTPVANRMQAELESLIGFFVNTLVLRADCRHETVEAFLAHIRQVNLDAQANQDIPFERLVELCKVARSTQYNPLFQIMFDMNTNKYDADSERKAGFKPILENRECTAVKFDMEISAHIEREQLEFSWVYDTTLFSEQTIARLHAHLVRLAESLVSQTSGTLGALTMLSEQEQHALLVQQNPAPVEAMPSGCVHHLFEQQVAARPEHPAVVFEGQTLSYRALDTRANQVANYLRTHHDIGRDSLVGLYAERSLEMVIGMLGILKAGGAYVPLDPNYPAERLSYMLSDTQAQVVLSTQETDTAPIANSQCQWVSLHDAAIAAQPHSNPEVDCSEQDLAYIIYTSGSTGKPKGVMLEHQGVVNLVATLAHTFNIQPQDKLLQFSPISFDMSVEELFGALCCGSTLVLRTDEWLASVADFWAHCETHQISLLNLPTAFWHEVVHEQDIPCASHVRQVCVGGDKLSEQAIATWYETRPSHIKLLNAYGPTEYSVNATIAEVDPAKPLSIGHAVLNTQLLVLSPEGQLLPHGIVGELHLGGPGLARGYLNRPDLTAERFIDNPFYTDAIAGQSPRLYKTGDLVKMRANGEVEYIGRSDNQVKIRGFRIELGEIEAALASHESVTDSLVMAQKPAHGGEAQLLAYVLCDEKCTPSDSELKHHLKAFLPAYMMPQHYISVTQWPMTPNGKVDRKALPTPELTQDGADYHAPQGEVEVRLTEIWAELLGIDASTISTSANFFTLGGHSLLVIRLVSEIRRHLHTELPIKLAYDCVDLRALAQHIATLQGGVVRTQVEAKASAEGVPLPLSFAQQRLWFIDRLEEDSSQYNMPAAFKISGSFDTSAAETALLRIIERHEVLRTVYVEGAEGSAQVIRPFNDVKFAIQHHDLRDVAGDAQAAQVQALMQADSEQAFDLTKDVMLRAAHIVLSEEEGVLLFNMHHIASDGWSMGLLSEEFITQYESICAGHANPYGPLALQYADFALWQHEWLQGEVLDEQVRYWQTQLDALPAVHSLPLDFARPAEKAYTGETYTGVLSSTLTGQLQELAQRHQMTLFMVLHGVLSLVLSRHSNQHDIVLGTPVANRMQAELESLIGFFVNTLVLRADCRHETVEAYLAHIRQVNLDAQANQDIPFERLVELCKVARSTQYNPLFQIMFDMDTNQFDEAREAATGLIPLDAEGQTSVKFDMEVSANLADEQLEFSWVYDTTLFSEQTIARLHAHLVRLAESLVSQTSGTLGALTMLSEQEQHALLVQQNPAPVEAMPSGCVHHLFEQQVAARPEHPAVVFEGQTLSYRALDTRANQVANYLRTHHDIGRDSLVGLYAERSLEMVIGMLGILKAGGAYVPLDPNYPAERLSYMLSDTQAQVVLSTQVTDTAPIANSQCQWVSLHDAAIAAQPHSNPEVDCSEQDLAYIIYTSGSTGKPKGVMLEHQGVVNLVATLAHTFNIQPQDKLLQFSPISFDMSVEELFGALCCGSTLVLRTDEWLASVADFWAHCETHQISLLNLPTAFWHEVVHEQDIPCASHVRQVCVGGDKLSEQAIATWYETRPSHIKLLNAYGPTEYSVNATIAEVDPAKPLSIGHAVLNTQLLVLSPEGQLLPHGIVGELHLGGPGLARGYLNRPDLTAERFIDNPFYTDAIAGQSPRLYKTGDLVKMRANGEVEYIGRSDNQVKIRGFRIELGEIEAALASHESVTDSLVMAQKPAHGGEAQLLAYVLCDEKCTPSDSELKHHLKAFLPAYMMPQHYISVTQWPMTPNGKVDRKALPTPELTQDGADYHAPQGEVEVRLTEIWAELLGIDASTISTSANFFTLGGHSLLVIRLVSEIRRHLHTELPIKLAYDCVDLRALAQHIATLQGGVVRTQVEAKASAEGVPLPLSFAQQRLWFIDRLEEDSSQYNMPAAFKISGSFDTSAAETALLRIIERHEVLRTVYVEGAEGSAQVIRPFSDVKFAIQHHDLRDVAGDAQAAQVQALMQADSEQAFDLTKDVMLRAAHIVLSEEEGVLLFNMHHIASDGWSMGLLSEEFITQYESICAGHANPYGPLALQYADFALWQHEWLQGEVLDEQVRYWQTQLDALPAVHSLPLDFARPAEKAYTGETYTGVLSSTLTGQLQELAQRHQMTLFMVLHGVLSLVLSRHSNQHDIVLGTPVANRMQAELESLIGFFVNTLVLRADCRHETVEAYLAHIRQVNLDAQANQDIPFERLVELCKVARSTQYNPLFQIMFDMDTNQFDEAREAATGLIPLDAEGQTSVKFDMEVSANLADEQLEFSWVYDTTLFSEQTIARLHAHLVRLAESLVSQTSGTLGALTMLSEQEQHALLVQQNPAPVEAMPSGCVHHLFEQQVAARPEHPAVVFEGQTLSYRALDTRANQVANYLRTHHDIGRDSLVGLYAERSLEMVIGMLGILKAGGAYVPLDPNYPAERLSYMLSDTQAQVVLSTQVTDTAPIANSQCQWVSLHDAAIAAQPHSNPEVDCSEQDLAYIIYTSGSTGKPKGVMLEHRGVVNLVATLAHTFNIQPQDKLLQFAPISFDMSVEELFGALCCGSTLVLRTDEWLASVADFWAHCETHQISLLNLPTAFWHEVVHEQDIPCASHVRQVCVGGDKLSEQAIATWYETRPSHIKLLNAYGPTEYSVNATIAEVDPAKPLSIGHAVLNTQLLVLSPEGQLLPHGIVGELHLGGPGLARGYLNRPDLTAERFIDNPFYTDAIAGQSPRLYKTGDLVKMRANGEVEYIGRSDNQVKIRGFRIELGEIEAALASHESVTDSLVMAQKPAHGGEAQLLAYVLCDEKCTPSDSELKHHLKAFLPAYMMPQHYISVTQWPMTPNGKVDRKALPTPELTQDGADYHAPQGEVEVRLTEIWAELLGIDASTISTSANFFTLGGHSLLVIRLVSEIRRHLHTELPIKLAYDCVDLRALAQHIATLQGGVVRTQVEAKASAEGVPLPLSFAQQRLWFIDRLEEDSSQYNMPAAFKISGSFDTSAAETALLRIIERHEVLRTVYVEGAEGSAQVIRPFSDVKFAIQHHDLRDVAGDAQAAQVQALMQADSEQAFDLTKDVMLRAAHIVLSEEEGVLLFNMHHIASDGWSMGLLSEEFITQYESICAGHANPYGPLALQYADFALWQHEWLQGEVLDEQVRYWQTQLDALPAVHSLPLDFARPAEKAYTGETYTGVLSSTLTGQLQELAQRHQMTLFMVLHGVLSLVLSRHSNQHDIVLGTPVANRMQAELESLIGFFVNTLVLRADCRHETVEAYLAHIRQVNLDAQANQDIPFERLVELCKVARSTQYNPLFQIMFDMDTNQFDEAREAATGLIPLDAEGQTSVKFDMEVSANLADEQLEFSWVYDTTLFSEQTIARLHAHLVRLAESLVSQTSGTLGALTMLSEQEQHALLVQQNPAPVEAMPSGCVHHLFEQQVAARPEHPAVVFEGQTLSYRALDTRANQVANYLRTHHDIGRDSLVGLYAERSLEMVIGMLGILKAGGAYVPLDPNYPAERLSYMLSDTQAQVVLSTQVTDTAPIANSQCQWVSLHDAAIAAQPHSNPEADCSEQDLAYIIYTSGSTGKPKGVMIEHSNTVSFLTWCGSYYRPEQLSSVLFSTSINFDVSVFELFAPLTVGGKVVIVDRITSLMERDYEDEQISLVSSVPSGLEVLVKANAIPASVKTVNSAGEKLNLSLLNQLIAYQNVTEVVNLYGPSEDTTYSTVRKFTAPETDTPPLGYPIDFTRGFILDQQMNLVPFGSVGELYLEGAGVTRGYLNNPELTQEKYLNFSFDDDSEHLSNLRLYKTGDLVKWNRNGELEYLGRIDGQVKIRGFRIELSEIEVVLSQLDGISEAVVLAQSTPSGEAQLIAYVSVVHDVDMSEQSIRQHLKDLLPDYMIPSFITFVSDWPLHPNGKINKNVLPEIFGINVSNNYVGASNDIEENLINIWSDLLGLNSSEIGVDDNFFSIGGHSLLVMKMINLIGESFDVNLPVKLIYDFPTVREISNSISLYKDTFSMEDEFDEDATVFEI